MILIRKVLIYCVKDASLLHKYPVELNEKGLMRHPLCYLEADRTENWILKVLEYIDGRLLKNTCFLLRSFQGKENLNKVVLTRRSVSDGFFCEVNIELTDWLTIG